jgi:hypothetical protein
MPHHRCVHQQGVQGNYKCNSDIEGNNNVLGHCCNSVIHWLCVSNALTMNLAQLLQQYAPTGQFTLLQQ